LLWLFDVDKVFWEYYLSNIQSVAGGLEE
jgi:hypothetical protein